MSLKDALDRVLKKIRDLSGDVKSSKDSLMDVVGSTRPRPIRNFVRKRVESIRPLRKKEERKEG